MGRNTEKENDRPFIKTLIRNLLAIVAIVVALMAVASVFLNIHTRHGKEITVPDFTNMSLEEAQSLASSYHLRIDVTDSVFISRMDRGNVYAQNPRAGSRVKKDRRILITRNATVARMVEMPSLVGYSLRQAQTVIASRGLTVGKLIYRNDMATNNVLAQQYKGRDVAPGRKIPSESVIDLVLGLSLEDDQTYVPHLIGYKYNTARSTIIENSLNVGRVIFDETVVTYSDSLDAMVYRQVPSSSEEASYRRGSTVNIFLTRDPEILNASNGR